MSIRDRIVAFRRVPAHELRPHPRNWRQHPLRQRECVRDMLNEVGYADALLVRECADGTLELIDGHLRADLTPDQLVPVLVLDVDEHDASKLLAMIDPLAAQAEADASRLKSLLDEIDWDSPQLAALGQEVLSSGQVAEKQTVGKEPRLAEAFRLLVDCDDEAAQQALFERLSAEGYVCRVLTL